MPDQNAGPVNPNDTGNKPKRTIPLGFAIAGGLAALFIIIGALSLGIGGALFFAGLIALGTALFALVTGRRSWARIPSRSIAAIGLAGALVLTIVGGAVAAPSSGTHPIANATSSSSTHSASTNAAEQREHAAAKKALAHSAAVAAAQAKTQAQATAKAQADAAAATKAAADAQAAAQAKAVADAQAAAQAKAAADAQAAAQAKAVADAQAAAQAKAAQAAAAAAAAAPPAAAAPAQSATIIPGAFCANSQNGVVAQSASGTSYKCGGHGADANGHLHWNTM